MATTAEQTKARKAAMAILKKYGITQPPVDVEAIARAEGIQVLYEQMEDRISGFFVKRKDSSAIGVNAEHHRNRQRFTLGHELGHYCLHTIGETVYVDEVMVHFRGEDIYAPAKPEEIEANAFAAELLMPSDFVKEDLSGMRIDAQDESAIKKLAQRYKVSQYALTIKLIELGLLRGLRPAF